MSDAVYRVLVEGRPWGALLWRNYRLLLVRGDGREHLFHRSVRLQKAREAVARWSGRPVGAVQVRRLAEAGSGVKARGDNFRCPTSREDHALDIAEGQEVNG